MKDFRQLKVWEKSHHLTLSVYQTVLDLPKDEKFGLSSQIKRSCASIAANIAEGCGREGDKEFAHFVNISLGSANELDYHLLLAHDLKLIEKTHYQNLHEKVNEVKKMLNALLKKLRANC